MARINRVWALGFAVNSVNAAAATAEATKRIPDEYETVSGHDVAMNNAGYAANDGYTAVRANPALLATQRQYAVSAGYHWPVSGRDYFQAGVVDSKTSTVAAGVSYTGYTDNYVYSRSSDATTALKNDSPVVRRGSIGAAGVFGKMALGIGATYVEAHPLFGSETYTQGETRIKGAGLNAGAAVNVAPGVSLGASVENASNRKIADYAPRTYRAGVAYQFSPMLTAFLDARQRDRVAAFEADAVDLDAPNADSGLMKEPERMVIASLAGQFEDYLRLTASYGQSTTDTRRSLAGGVAIVQKNFSLSYTAYRPYMRESAAHQAVTLSLDMAM